MGQWPHIFTQTFRQEGKLNNTFLLSNDSALRDESPMSYPLHSPKNLDGSTFTKVDQEIG